MKSKRKHRFLAAAGAVLLLQGCNAEPEAVEAEETVETRPAADYVSDIGLFDEELTAEITGRLQALHRDSGHEVHIETMLTLDDRPIEEVAAEMVTERGIGENGALLLVVLADEALILQPATPDGAFTASLREEAEAAMRGGLDGNNVPQGTRRTLEILEERLGEGNG